MLKHLRRFALRLAAIIVVVILLIAAYSYFRVSDRVRSSNAPRGFTNALPIMRLDSTMLSPDSVTSFVRVLMQKAKVHGIAMSIVNNNTLVYQQYFGKMDDRANKDFHPGAVFQAASFSKTVFADLVLQLAEEGVLHLDTPLYKYLQKPLFEYKTNLVEEFFDTAPLDYSDLETDARYKKITARMCLAHTTGFPNWRRFEDDGKLKFRFDPGTRYFYSGEGMYLLQFVIEELLGKPYEEIAVEKIFLPLDMKQSSYVWQRAYESLYTTPHDANGNPIRVPKRNYSNAAASLSTTLEDFTKYFMMVLAQKEKRYHELITHQVSIKSKQQFGPNSLVETGENDDIRLGYGLGFGIYETPWGRAFFKEGHNDGWQHYAVGFPDTGTALIIMSNSDNAEGIFKHLIEFCLANPYTPWFWEGYIPYDQAGISQDIKK